MPQPPSPQQSRPQNKKTELNFQPLSEGLGFHPFSDGLPYAPNSKAPTARAPLHTATPPVAPQPIPSGVGAVAAGPPSFAPRTHYQPAWPTPMPAPRVTEPAPAPRASELLDPGYGLGYLVKRIFAFLVDSLFNLSLCTGALSLAMWHQNLNPELLLNPGIVLVAALFLCFFNWAITTAEEVAFGTSIGKRLFGLGIQGSASAIFLRAFFFLPSLSFAGIGLIWALFDRRRRCWHDIVVDQQPIELSRQ